MKKILALVSGIVTTIGCFTLSAAAILQSILPKLVEAYYHAHVGSFSSDQYAFGFDAVYMVACTEIFVGILVLTGCILRKGKKD